MPSFEEDIRFFKSFNNHLETLYDLQTQDLSEGERMPIYQRLCSPREDYKKEELIGEGGMKRVFRAWDLRANRKVALAELREEAPKELYEAFLREAEVTASLEHPNIISIYDMGIGAKCAPYFTMELKVGLNLDQVLEGLKKGDPELREHYQLESLLEVFLKVCDAVAYAHSRQMLHLDLKPANIQMGSFGEVMVCDWGLAKIVGEVEEEMGDLLLNPDLLNHLTMHGEFKGTPGYMAPEQIEREGEKSFQSDIYALGGILYSILTLEKPIEGELSDLLSKTKMGSIVWPRSRTPERKVPSSLDAVVRRAMSLRSTDRYPTVALLRQEVRNFLSGYSTQAEKAGFSEEIKLFYRRNRAACRMGVGMAILLLAVTLGFFYFLNESRREASIARDKAQQAVALYEQVETEKAALSGYFFQEQHDRGYSYLISTTYYADPNRAVRQAIEFFDRILEKDPKHLPTRRDKGMALFFSQRFKEAAVYTEGTEETPLHELCLKYESKVSAEEGILSPEDFLSLMEEVSSLPNVQPKAFLERCVGWAMEKKKIKPAAPEAVKILLRCWNPQWSGEGFDYDPETQTLRLSGKGLSNLYSTINQCSGKSFLRYMPLKTLDLRGSEVYTIRSLKGSNITSLDVRGTLVTGLENFQDSLPFLKELIVAPGQFREKELGRRVPDSVILKIKSL